MRYRICLYVIMVQQCIGLAGELWMWLRLPPGHPGLFTTGRRFILFDGAGLALLLLALLLTRNVPYSSSEGSTSAPKRTSP